MQPKMFLQTMEFAIVVPLSTTRRSRLTKPLQTFLFSALGFP